MSAPITRKATTMNRMLPLLAAAAGSLLAVAAQAAAPGISGNTITLTASPAYLTQPDGLSVYSWGYGCTGGALASGQSFVPATTTTPFCTTMQVPGPTLVVTEGQTVTVTLTNNLPASAGNTSILFPGFTLTSACPAANQGLLTCEAAPGGSVTYTFTASLRGTRGGTWMPLERTDRALSPGLLHDQRPLDAGRHGLQLRGAVSAPALQRQSTHAPGRVDAAADHRPGALAAPLPRARQPRAHPGARRQPDSR